jgi:hypothetical protein
MGAVALVEGRPSRRLPTRAIVLPKTRSSGIEKQPRGEEKVIWGRRT